MNLEENEDEEFPFVSALTFAFSAAASGAGVIGLEDLYGVGLVLSPALLATTSMIALMNLGRNKSALSKVFSAASIGIGAFVAVQFMKASSEWGALLEPMMTALPATAAASLLNWTSHGTRNVGVQQEQDNKDDPTPKA